MYRFYLTKSLQIHNNLKAVGIKNSGQEDYVLNSPLKRAYYYFEVAVENLKKGR
jgi:hypothetical protein